MTTFGGERLAVYSIWNMCGAIRTPLHPIPQRVPAHRLTSPVGCGIAAPAFTPADDSVQPRGQEKGRERLRFGGASALSLESGVRHASAAVAPSPCALERNPSPVPGEGGRPLQ